VIRENEARYIAKCIQSARSCSIIGLSNMGKSTLIRELCSPDARESLFKDKADDFLFVYVDCNLMASRSEQAFHEATLRNIISALKRAGGSDGLLKSLNTLYQEVVQPGSPIRSPLAFDEAVRKICDDGARALVLLFDEFDEPFAKLDGRVFLNLRAMKDEYASELSFVTATERPLFDIRDDADSNEFSELFSSREVWLGFVNQDDAREVATEIADGTSISKTEMNFIINEAGGHAGLIKAVTETWMRISGGVGDADARDAALKIVKQGLDHDSNVRNECLRIWTQLSDSEHNGLVAHVSGKPVDTETLDLLQQKRLLTRTGDLNDVLLGRVWRDFVFRHGLTRPNSATGVNVDVESGDVSVDGRRVESLTDLEYKLLLLLYGKVNKLVDKYAIVTNVWGESYLDSVDDARIEKLVSRLRAKLEPGLSEPRYLITLRGRGYKLITPELND
jgi:hypothetical protein